MQNKEQANGCAGTCDGYPITRIIGRPNNFARVPHRSSLLVCNTPKCVPFAPNHVTQVLEEVFDQQGIETSKASGLWLGRNHLRMVPRSRTFQNTVRTILNIKPIVNSFVDK